jgi:hypothetical protein
MVKDTYSRLLNAYTTLELLKKVTDVFSNLDENIY